MTENGKLIALEGIDGCGKSTVQKYLAAQLSAMGYDTVMLVEPTDGKYGRELRERARRHERPDPQRETELFILDRKEDVRKNILPALERGAVVILDRYYISTAAYQGSRGLSVSDIIRRNEEFAPVPDLVIILDIQPDEGLKRVGKRGELDGFEVKEYLEKVRAIYLDLAKKRGFRVIDAARPLQKVQQDVLTAVLDVVQR